MHNLPKIPFPSQDSQLPSQPNTNLPHPIQLSESRKNTTSSERRNLSPFTWNNIKLPAVLFKEKLQKGNHEQQDVKQLVAKTTPNQNQILAATKLQTIGQKAKKALKISVQLRKMLPQRVSPLKNLHLKVLVQPKKQKLITGLKVRQNRSFTQNQAKKILAKTYETMQIKGQDWVDARFAKDYLLGTQQRYRNSLSQYQESEVGEVKGQGDHYGKQEKTQKKNAAWFRRKYQQSKHQAQQKGLINSLNSSIVVKSSRLSPSKNVHSHSINQQMQPYIRHWFNTLSKSKDPTLLKLFVTTNPKYHPLHLNSLNNSSSSVSSQPFKTLIWTKLESLNIFCEKTPEQFYNHVEGSHVLTSKEKLHEILNGGKGPQKSFYPLSFSLPKDYNEFVQEFDWMLVKASLKFLIRKIHVFEKGVADNEQRDFTEEEAYKFTVCLSDILEDLTRETKNESQLKMLKFCLFLESGRKKQNLCSLFEHIKTYRSVDITLSESLYIDTIDWCLQIVRFGAQQDEGDKQAKNTISNMLNLSNIDYRLIQLLKAYDYLFTVGLPAYLYRNLEGLRNSWLIKPFAASKAAGISLVINSPQFYTTPDYEYKEYRHRAKYHNKILMKYVENPFLIKHSGIDYFAQKHLKQLKKEIEQEAYQQVLIKINQKIDKFLQLEEKFFSRKFDIRQWVMIVCDEQVDGQFGDKDKEKIMSSKGYEGKKSPRGAKTSKRFKLYKYHTGYCRFARKKYSLATSDPEVHLTNYEMYKKSFRPDSKSKSPCKQHRLPNAPILEKSDYLNNVTQQKGMRNQPEQGGTRNKVGLISREERDSVLMLEELFEYLDFVAEIKRPEISTDSSPWSSLKQGYESQLDFILQSVFESSLPHLTHHQGTFQLLGVDLLLDEHENLYLLEVNLNPGCSTSRNDKLYQESQTMVQTMFETVIGENRRQSQELKHRRIQEMQQKMVGSREFIGDTQLEIQGDAQNQNIQEKDIKKSQQSKDRQEKVQKTVRKWALVAEKDNN